MSEKTACVGDLEIADIDEKRLRGTSRQELLEVAEKLLLVMSPDSGFGFGICRVANMMAWSMAELAPGEKDWPSILATRTPLDRYENEELIRMLLFARQITLEYDKYFIVRKGANTVILDKAGNGRWMLKRLSWEYGPFYHDSLEKAISHYNAGEK